MRLELYDQWRTAGHRQWGQVQKRLELLEQTMKHLRRMAA